MKIGGADSMECYTYLRNVQDLLSDGKTLYERLFGEPFQRTNHSVWFIGWVSSYNCQGPVKNPLIWKESLTWIVPRIRTVRKENVEGWRTGCRPWGVGDDGRIGNLLEKTQCERGDISQTSIIYFSNRRWTNQTPWRRSRLANIHLDTAATKSKRKSRWFSWRIRRVSSTTSRLVSGCRWSDRWLLVHVRKLHIPPSRWTQSQTLLAERRIIPYSTEVHWRIRTTHTNLHVKQEKRIDDKWNIDGPWDLSDPWTGFAQFTILEEKHPNGYMWSGWRLTRKQLTSRPDHLWPELWEKVGKNAKLKERQKWSHEKPQLDNARKLRGTFSLTLRTRTPRKPLGMQEKLRNTKGPAMPCKTCKKSKHGETRSKTDDFKSKFSCILEASESTRIRMEEPLPKYHEDHFAGKGDKSLQH